MKDYRTPESYDAEGCARKFYITVSLLLVIIALSVKSCMAQPQVFLQSSRTSVARYMRTQEAWTRTEATPELLQYCNNEGVCVSYSFGKRITGNSYYCTSCTITLPDSNYTDGYIRDRLAGYRFVPAREGWELLTDLVDYRILVIRKGNTLVYKRGEN